MRCSVCGEVKRRIRAVKSACSTYRFFSCDACMGREPRWLLILVGRSEGLERVRELVTKERYRGEEIAMVELLG